MKAWSTALVLALAVATNAARAQGCGTEPQPGAGVPPASVNPVIALVLGAVTPVAGTDGRIHLAYAAQVTNLALEPATLEALAPVDPMRKFAPTGRNVVLDVDGKPIIGLVRAFGTKPDAPREARKIGPGGSGIVFFDVTYPKPDAVPAMIAHRIAVRFADGRQVATLTDPIRLACNAPVRLSPPLAGHGWWDVNGCCETVNAHRGATLPMNGGLRLPEQFAIDFVQIAPDGTCCDGPVRAVSSWRFQGAPVFAVAAGTVVEASDTQPDQVPGPAEGVTIENAGGNHVIEDIGGGHWVLYAHLRPGSVAVHPGEALAAGERLGAVGNSGSSTAPHLHFQVMDRPSMLNATGLPFVFGRQVMEGAVLGTPAQAERDYEAGRPVRVDREGAGPRTDEMPAEGQVFGFRLE